MQMLGRKCRNFVALAIVMTMIVGCGESLIQQNDGPKAQVPINGNESEAIEADLPGEVFDFDYTLEGATDDLFIDGQAQPTEILPEFAFRGINVFFTGDDAPAIEYQVATSEDQWGTWTRFAPESSYAGMFGGIINLSQAGVAFRFRSTVVPEYVRFEFFEDPIEHGEHDHDHGDESLLFDDDDYMSLDDDDEELSERIGELSVQQDDADLSVRRQELITSCSKTKMAAYSGGRRLADITVIKMDHKNVGLNTASAYEKMRIAAARDGVRIQIVSGFRTMAEQTYFYNCYLSKRCNNGNLAARPGYSNHQNGLALDLNTRGAGVANWLNRNGARFGFKRTVPSELWHWEYRAGTTVSPQVCGGGGGGGGSTNPPPPPPPPPRYDANLSVKFLGLTNFYPQGSSRHIGDALIGDRFKAEVLLTNRSSVRIGPVRMGYWFEHPFLKATNYRIDTDSPHHNRSSWRVNSANSEAKNPAKNNMGRTGLLEMHSFAPGESKRVVIDLIATEYSVGRADHPDIRVWVRHIANVYGEHTSFGGSPSTNKIGKVLRAHAQVDVLKADEWQFASKKNAGDLEGWRACHDGHHDRFLHNTNHGLMSMHVTGNNACAQSPAWTNIDASRFDQLVIGARSHDGKHTKAISWAPDSCAGVKRVSGADRYSSSAAVSRHLFPAGAQTAVLVLGTTHSADAIVAGPLAAQLGGPVLLTGNDTLPAAIATELRRLKPAKVVIVGGTSAISASVELAVRALGPKTERLAGQTRFTTAAVVAKSMGSPTREALIVSADSAHLVDAVLAASLAAGLKIPVLYVQGDTVAAETRSALTALNIQRTIIVGGPSSVSAAIASKLPSPRRLSGASRFATARAVADFAISRGVSDDHIYITRADNLIDAFSVTHTGNIIMLSNPAGLHPITQKFIEQRAGDRSQTLFKPVTLLGGVAALSKGVESSTCLAVEGVESFTVKFEARGDSKFQTLVIPMSDHPNWSGKVHSLRIYPLAGKRPAAGTSGWYDFQRVLFQSSRTRTTNSARQGFSNVTPVTLTP